MTVTASDGKGGTDATDSFDLTVLGDLITYTTSNVGSTYTVDISLNQNGVQTAEMESVGGFNLTIGGTGTAGSSSGIEPTGSIPPTYATVDVSSVSRDGLSKSLYTETLNSDDNIFISDATWTYAAADSIPIISEASSWMETISGQEWDLISLIDTKNSIGQLSFTLEDDVTDFDLIINGTISGFDSSQNALASSETITAVTIDII